MANNLYNWKPQDTWESVAKAYRTTVSSLLGMNQGNYPASTGQAIRVPNLQDVGKFLMQPVKITGIPGSSPAGFQTPQTSPYTNPYAPDYRGRGLAPYVYNQPFQTPQAANYGNGVLPSGANSFSMPESLATYNQQQGILAKNAITSSELSVLGLTPTQWIQMGGAVDPVTGMYTAPQSGQAGSAGGGNGGYNYKIGKDYYRYDSGAHAFQSAPGSRGNRSGHSFRNSHGTLVNYHGKHIGGGGKKTFSPTNSGTVANDFINFSMGAG